MMMNSYFSLSPCHFETKSDEDTEKKVDSASVATALARYDFPVPGGYWLVRYFNQIHLRLSTIQLTPYSRIPFHGLLFPVNNWGKRDGSITASFKASLAASNPATSSHFTLGFSETMAAMQDQLCEERPKGNTDRD